MNDKSNIPPVVAEFALEQLASDRCTCCTCGYTWVKGQHGGHSCAQVMEVTVADLRARLANYEDAEGRPVATLLEPYGWVAAGGFYTDRQAAIEAAGKTPCIDVYSLPQMDASETRSLQRQAVAEYLAKELDSACAEIRALKAQPSGVVDERE